MQHSLSNFQGTKRRFEKVGNLNGAQVFLDYAHHPDEIKSSIATAKIFTKNKLIAIFQPHTYSRTAVLFDEFASCFGEADKVAFYPIFPAREEPMPGITHEALCKKCKEFNDAVSLSGEGEMIDFINCNAQLGNTILILGAGDYVCAIRQLHFN